MRQIPNTLTLGRAAIAVLFFVAISQYRYPLVGEGWLWAAIVLFGIAVLTDFLDGWLARRWNVVTGFGRIMDPFCDKLLILGALICLAGPRFVVPEWEAEGRTVTTASGLTSWMVVIVIARELFVTSVRGIMESRGFAFGAKWSGKVKMSVQSAAIPAVLVLILVAPPSTNPVSEWIIHGMMWTMVGITILSGLPYARVLPTLMRNNDLP